MSFRVSRQKHSLINVVLALVSRVAVIIAGLFLPFTIIQVYGSETNGLVSSLQQIIAYFILVEGGLIAASVFALYKPLSQDNTKEVNLILSATKRFYYKAGIAYCCLLFIAMAGYPYVIAKTAFSEAEVMALVLFIGMNGVTQLWFNGKYKPLLLASQYSGVVSVINSASTVLYCIIIIILAQLRVYVIYTFAVASFAYIARALAFHFATKKIHPHVDFNVESKNYNISQKNDVLLQFFLDMLVMNSGVILLTIVRAPMEIISVFTVYNLVLASLYMLMDSINTGIAAGFGDLIARDDAEKLSKTYKEFETIFQMIWTWVFSCLSILYLPFIRVYTLKVTDVQYVLPTDCLLFTLIGAFWTIRNQQSILINAAGKYNEIRNGSVIEAALTGTLSLVGFKMFGLTGLLGGRLLATVYRAMDFVLICNKHIVKIPIHFTLWQIGLSMATVCVSYAILTLVFTSYPDSIGAWMIEAVFCATINALIMVAVRMVFDQGTTLSVLQRVGQILRNVTLVGRYRQV